MVAQCTKCGKDYEPKRRGGKFCSTSCRVVHHQKVKAGKIWPNPNTGDELYLANKLAAVERSSREVLARVENLPAEQAVVELRRLVEGWTGASNNTIIMRILDNDTKERNINYAAYFKRTGLY